VQDADVDTAAELRQMVNAFQLSKAIQVAAVLGISDLLAIGPATSAELAHGADCDERALRRLMRALAAAGVYVEVPEDTFANTELGAALRSDHPERLRDWAVNVDRATYWNTWGQLLGSIHSGENTFTSLHGMSVWEYRAQHPEDNEAFDKGMTAYTLPVAGAVAEAYDFTGLRTVVDIGGSRGVLLSAVLRAYPDCRGILFDQPHVVAGARPELEAAGVADRCEVVGGSFFDSVPEGGDAYLLKSILHDWEDDDCIAILQTCRAAMNPGALCLLVERILAGPNEGLSSKLSDLNMLVMPGGRERSLAEYDRLLEIAGLRPTRAVATTSEFQVIEAVAS
jgi:hypothetical protein